MKIQSLLMIALTTVFSFTAPMVLNAQQSGGMMSMDKMMKECRQHCQRTRDSAARLQKTLEDARQSNDPAKMRSAIEQAQKPLAEMQEHMDMCMKMMSMHGKGGMMHGSPDQQKKQEKQQ